MTAPNNASAPQLGKFVFHESVSITGEAVSVTCRLAWGQVDVQMTVVAPLGECDGGRVTVRGQVLSGIALIAGEALEGGHTRAVCQGASSFMAEARRLLLRCANATQPAPPRAAPQAPPQSSPQATPQAPPQAPSQPTTPPPAPTQPTTPPPAPTHPEQGPGSDREALFRRLKVAFDAIQLTQDLRVGVAKKIAFFGGVDRIQDVDLAELEPQVLRAERAVNNLGYLHAFLFGLELPTPPLPVPPGEVLAPMLRFAAEGVMRQRLAYAVEELEAHKGDEACAAAAQALRGALESLSEDQEYTVDLWAAAKAAALCGESAARIVASNLAGNCIPF